MPGWARAIPFDEGDPGDSSGDNEVRVRFPDAAGEVTVWLPELYALHPDTRHRKASLTLGELVDGARAKIAGALRTPNDPDRPRHYQLVTWDLDLSMSPGLPLMAGCVASGSSSEWEVKLLDVLSSTAAEKGTRVRWWRGQEEELEKLVGGADCPRVFSEDFGRRLDRGRGPTYLEACVRPLGGIWVAIVGYFVPNAPGLKVVRIPDDIHRSATELSAYVRTHPHLGERIGGLTHTFDRPKGLPKKAYGHLDDPWVYELSALRR